MRKIYKNFDVATINKTNLQTQLGLAVSPLKKLANYKVGTLSLNLLSILLGFFTSTALSTIPAQTGDWGIVAAAIIVINQEIISRINYHNHVSAKHKLNAILKTFLKYCNSIKIGILYGLFVDAFKLGS